MVSGGFLYQLEEKLSATARLERVQQVIDEELGWAVQEARREGGDRGALADVILKLAGEVRQQLGLQLSISRTLVEWRVVKEFHDTVVAASREPCARGASPGCIACSEGAETQIFSASARRRSPARAR